MFNLDKECQDLLSELQRRMGRNLMGFQQIETAFKILLPNMHIAGTQEAAGSKHQINQMTLGGLKGKYLSCLNIESESPSVEGSVIQEFYETNLKKLVDSRNQLVHKFFHIPGIDTLSKEGLENGLRYLDQQFYEAMTFYKEDIAPQLLFWLWKYSENNPHIAEEIQPLCKLLDSFLEKACTIKVYDRDYIEIINLLKLAEHNTPKIESMTSLARAGKFIKTKAPEFNPKQYGQKTLKAILLATGMFEIRELVHKNGKTVLYRTKPSSKNSEYYVFPKET
ncbi:MAG: OST-HTH/LOTUS domain-containing protein [Candidatus Competibacteraceae bacterium]